MHTLDPGALLLTSALKREIDDPAIRVRLKGERVTFLHQGQCRIVRANRPDSKTSIYVVQLLAYQPCEGGRPDALEVHGVGWADRKQLARIVRSWCLYDAAALNVMEIFPTVSEPPWLED